MTAPGVASVMLTCRLPLNVSVPGLSIGAVAGGIPFSRPNTLTCDCAPTYTFPLTTVGTVNFTARPGLSRELFTALEYNVVPGLLASWACRIAEPLVM